MHWGLFCFSSLKLCILVSVVVCFGLMKIRLPSVSLLCTWSDCMAIFFVNSFCRIWYWDLFVTQNLWFCWFSMTAALFLFVPFLLKDVSMEMFSNAYKIPFYSLIPTNLCSLVSPGILINVPTTTLVLILLPLGRHYTPIKNLEKGTVIVQLVQQPEMRLVDKLSMAQWCSLVAKTIEQHSGLLWDQQQQQGGHPASVLTAGQSQWSAVPSPGLPSRHKDLWSLPVLGAAQNQTGMGKIPVTC